MCVCVCVCVCVLERDGDYNGKGTTLSFSRLNYIMNGEKQTTEKGAEDQHTVLLHASIHNHNHSPRVQGLYKGNTYSYCFN